MHLLFVKLLFYILNFVETNFDSSSEYFTDIANVVMCSLLYILHNSIPSSILTNTSLELIKSRIYSLICLLIYHMPLLVLV